MLGRSRDSVFVRERAERAEVSPEPLPDVFVRVRVRPLREGGAEKTPSLLFFVWV